MDEKNEDTAVDQSEEDKPSQMSTRPPPSESIDLVKNETHSLGVDDTHLVNITITTSVAYPKPMDEHSRLIEELMKRNKRTMEAPKPHQYFHSEYTIAPRHDRTVTDVVTYAVAAKVFTENESKLVKTWDDGQNIWVAWMHNHQLEVNSKNVVSLYNHTIEMKVWDAKEKVSIKARTDRPKAFRLPSGNDAAFPGKGVQAVVAKQSNSWQKLQPRDSVTDARKKSEPKTKKKEVEKQKSEPEKPTTEKEDIRTTNPPMRVRSSLGRLAGINASEEEKKRINELKRQQAKLQKELAKSGKQVGGREKVRRSGETKVQVQDPKETEEERKETEVQVKRSKMHESAGRTSVVSARFKAAIIRVKLEHLFGGTKVLSARLVDPVGSIKDALITISLDGPLLPDDLERSLNPLVIKLKSVKDLPSTPQSYSQLETTCEPVYCTYSFLNHPYHITEGRPHGKHVYFEDSHVILLGRMNDGEVREYIQSQSLHVNVHDRDQKEEHKPGEPSLFGEEKFDKELGSVALISTKKTAFNPFHSKKKAYDPYGVAKVPLMDILRGQTTLHLRVSVNPCSLPDMMKDPPNLDDNTRLVGVPGAVDRPVRPPQLAGHYIQAGTTLKMKVTLRYPFVPNPNVPRLLPMPHQVCPFSRMIYYFSYANKELLRRIENFVTRNNAKALRLDHFEPKVIEAALSTYKLSVEQKRSRDLDIVTGFHVIDGDLHLVVIEGLRDGAMHRMLDEVKRTEQKDGETLVHLYDSSMSFNSRLYASLDVDMCRVRLHQTMREILQQPLLYVRDMVPKACLECITKVHQMTQLSRLRDVVHSNLFPTAEMVISMCREFGVPLTYDDFESHHREVSQVTVEPAVVETKESVEHLKRRWTPMDNFNPEYVAYLEQKKDDSQPDYVAMNVVAVQEAGKRRRPAVQSLTADVPAHNYSTQALNSTELGKDILRNMLMESDPNGRYTYHPTYNSAMLVPVNVEAFHRAQDDAAKRAWRTEDGFVYPGVKSSRACNVHPLKPDESRIEELTLRFRDNVLHRNIMEPTLNRERMPWDDRSKDIELYRRPPSKFGESPVTIHLAGNLRKQEALNHKKAEETAWKSRLVVDDPEMKFHRVLAATEQTNASNQLDRLTSLLKDQPKKYGLRKQPAPSIPPLSVVLNPSVDTAARAKGKKLPPAFDERREENVGFAPGPFDDTRWTMESNKIPIKDENHRLFARKHGHDMNLYHKERTLLSKHVLIKPLTQDEMETHLFRIPPRPDDGKDPEPETDAKQEEPEAPKLLERSEYRYKFSDPGSGKRLTEIYPRHTFHGFGPLDQSGKPITNHASVQLIELPAEIPEHTNQRQPFGTPVPGDASVEITSQPIPAT